MELTQSAVDKFVSQDKDNGRFTFTIDDEKGNLTIVIGAEADKAFGMNERSRALTGGKVIIEGNLRSWQEWDVDVDFDKIKSAAVIMDCYYWRGGNKVRGTLSLRTLNTDTKELTSTPLKKTYRLWENAWD